MANLDTFGRKGLAIVTQAPRSHILRRAMVHADDDVAIPRPGVILIILAGLRRMIRMRMIPPDDLQPLRLCCCFGIRAATAKQPKSAAAELGLTRRPSSRASRFTRR